MDHDDPEKRIAELERQLAERMRIAAPGPQQAAPAPPSPVSPTPYGVGSGGAPNGELYGIGPGAPGFRRWQLRRPLRRWRLVWVLVLFWLVMIPVGNVLGGVFMRTHHYPSSGPRGVTQGTWPVPTPPTTGVLTVAPGGVLSAGGAGETETIACNDGTLNLSGYGNTFTVTGHCRRLEVLGSALHVTVDSADTINASGLNIAIIYHSGTPKSTKSGTNVTVDQG
jgi:DUF3060 family protein